MDKKRNKKGKHFIVFWKWWFS